jgi:hypothetical protein
VLKKNPLFLYSSDGFQKPYAFRADIADSLDDAFDTKLAAVHELASQVYEGGASGSEEFVKNVPPATIPEARKRWLRERWEKRQSDEAIKHRDALVRWYGEEQGKKVKYAEAFEICEYGRKPTEAEIRQLFPMLPKAP